jgi:NADH:ubiquinone oxidoreductase subunit 6 (subunit J)
MKDYLMNVMWITAAIVFLFLVKQCLQWKSKEKTKEGFLDGDTAGLVAGGVLLLVLVSVGVAYTSYQIKF